MNKAGGGNRPHLYSATPMSLNASVLESNHDPLGDSQKVLLRVALLRLPT